MLELIVGIIIGAAFADFWKHLYAQGLKALKDFSNKSSS